MSLVKGGEPGPSGAMRCHKSCGIQADDRLRSLQALDHPPMPRVSHQQRGRTAALCDLSALIFFPIPGTNPHAMHVRPAFIRPHPVVACALSWSSLACVATFRSAICQPIQPHARRSSVLEMHSIDCISSGSLLSSHQPCLLFPGYNRSNQFRKNISTQQEIIVSFNI
jgi:hypothetical protein